MTPYDAYTQALLNYDTALNAGRNAKAAEYRALMEFSIAQTPDNASALALAQISTDGCQANVDETYQAVLAARLTYQQSLSGNQ